MRVRSVEVLKQLRAPEAAAYLEDSILDSQATVRATAAFALGEIGSKNLKPLIGALKLDPATQVRLHAADSLMKIGGQEGLVALKDSFLNLGEHFLPADAATQLWKTLKRNLDQLECLEECLAATESMSAEAFRRWSKVGVTSGDVETLVLTAHYAPTRFDEIMNALSRATVIFGELTAVEQFVKGLALPGVSRSATLKVLESLPISSSAFARLSSELQSIISDDPDEKVRLQALAILGRSNSISQEVASIKADKSVGEDGASTLRDEVRIRTVEQADLRNNESDRSENLYALEADENGPFRQQFRKYLEHEGIAVLGEVGTYMEMESILDQLPPETIVFCSASLPGCHMHLGQIEQKCAGRPIIFLAGAMRDDKSNESLEKHSSLVFVTRGGYQETVLEAVQQVGKGIKQEYLELS